jgi:hypothetical protein
MINKTNKQCAVWYLHFSSERKVSHLYEVFGIEKIYKTGNNNPEIYKVLNRMKKYMKKHPELLDLEYFKKKTIAYLLSLGKTTKEISLIMLEGEIYQEDIAEIYAEGLL